jgi:type II secretory pathway pseudopilin PulG
LLVLLSVVVIALALLLPAVVKARAAADKDDATNNLKVLGLAVANYETANANLPLGCDANNFSATAKLLPFIEQDNLYKAIDFKKPMDDKANAKTRATIVKTFLSPRDPIQKVSDDFGATNYLANDLVLRRDKPLRLVAITDGTSNTILWGETLKGEAVAKEATVKRQHVAMKKETLKDIKDDAGVKDFKDGKNLAADRCASWMDGRFLQGTFNGRLAPNDERPDVTCEGFGGLSALRSLDDTILVGMADSSVKKVNAKKITHKTWKNAIDPQDGNVLGDDWQQATK